MRKIRNRKCAGLTLLGNFQAAFPHANPQRDCSVPIDCPECISLFPVTGQPDFAETLEELVASYNSVRRNIEELVKLSRNLADEQQRHVRENMTEQGSVIFNILTRPAPELGADEHHAVKKVARRLRERNQAFRVLDWWKRPSSHARVEDVSKDVLNPDLPRACGQPLYAQQCSALFEHIYESYPERDAGVSAMAS